MGHIAKDSELFKQWETFHKGLDTESIQVSFANHLEYSLSKDQYTATPHDLYLSLALTVRDRMIERWIRTQQTYYNLDVKMIYYLSAEYLMGRALVNNLINLCCYREALRALEDLSIDPAAIIREEQDAGLGNGGLGRLAACFLDSMATHELPAVGYGIRYEFGMFEQEIRDCAQVECPDEWLKYGNPWEIVRPERTYVVRFYGGTREKAGGSKTPAREWVGTSDVIGIAYDTPINGYGNNTVNTLRLWSARASRDFDLTYFQHGDYLKAVEEKNISENISKVLYPNDNIFLGQELRLKQQYFFVSCSIQDIIRRYMVNHQTFELFPDRVAIQLNDTHPSLAITELLRIFIDDYRMSWDEAWKITERSFAFTNHTLLSEALEMWPVSMFERLLPRHLEIIYEINRRFLNEVASSYGKDQGRLSRMSLIEEAPSKKIRMANLAIVGSHSVNGVSRIHTSLLKERAFRDFDEMFPGRFGNITNGVTQRRWLLVSNPGLSELITGYIGEGWIRDLSELKKLEPCAEDPRCLEDFRRVKEENKKKLSEFVRSSTGTVIDPASIFDVQVKRIHEYKRQLLNILHVISMWLRLKDDPGMDYHPHTFIFGGTAAPAYFEAKLIIQLICRVAETLNGETSTRDRLKVLFLPNYRVSTAEIVIPAADISEQISTAGFEASGTGNMKFALNGALTVGTQDGANIEIMEEAGPDNIFIFGLTANEAAALYPEYQPSSYYSRDELLRRSIDLVKKGFFHPRQPDIFRPIVDSLLSRDRYLVLADFESYRNCHQLVDKAFRDRDRWSKMAVLNVARCGKFSSDRTILQYNENIWRAVPVKISRGTDDK